MSLRIFLVPIFLLSQLFANPLASQNLVRRGFHGAAFTPVGTIGIVVGKISTEGTAFAAGLLEGDTLLDINGQPVITLAAVKSLALKEGDKVTYTYKRGGKKRKISTRAKGRSKEQFSQGEVTYVAIPFGQNVLRGIVNKPHGPGPFPTVLFIQGYTCSSVCDLPEWHPYRRVPEGLAQKGFAVLRLEKPGLGESIGPIQCEDMDLVTEAAAFESGLNWLEKQPFAAQGKTYIYGHSLGGIVAPLISQKHTLAGVAAYGTIHTPWLEYFYQMLRTQGPNMGQDYLENEQAMRQYHKLLNLLLVERKTPQEALKVDSSFRSSLVRDFQFDGGRRLLGRDISTYWDLNQLNLTEAWAKTTCPVLIGFGTADIEVMTSDGPKTVVAIVNRYHPQNGTYVQLEGMNHGFSQVGSQELEYKNQDYEAKINNYKINFDARAITFFTEWVDGLKQPN